jgi:primosomal protein N' (replication factor Y)
MDSSQASAAATAAGNRRGVLLPLPLDGVYDYRVPDDMAPEMGALVLVPLGARRVVGVVWGPGEGEVDENKLKDIISILDIPPLTDELRALIDWTADYTLSRPGSVLRMALSVPGALEPPRPEIAYVRVEGAAAENESPDGRIRMTDARRRVLRVLDDGVPRRAAELARHAAVTPGVVRGLVDAGLVERVSVTTEPRFDVPDWRRAGPVLSADQKAAADALAGDIGAAGESQFTVSLLDGVTGSGKTEVYFEAIAAAIAAGRQALVMLPEIALTAQWLERFARRFDAAPAQWHSDLTGTLRRSTWRAVASGEVRIVVGARSALFLPYRDLGLIVVDEEHDQSFKQEDGVIYNARDMAVVRGRMGAFPVVLASATPSLETVVNCESGRYRRLALTRRHGGASLPDIRVVDMREEKLARDSWISPALRAELDRVLAAGEQAMLYLNRRGYAPLTLCRACGHRLSCPQCTAWLVEHRLAGRLQCHHCGYATRLPETCPSCSAADPFAACGPGVERLAEEAAAALPRARLGIMASDTIHGPAAAADLVARVQAREIDVLIGTQIMAKGHHFPMLTLVGVIDADLGLAGGDLRAAERTYQLLGQVAGRAGREERPGMALLQTYDPGHPVIQALAGDDRDGFLAAEIEARRDHAMPPFGRLAALIVSGRDPDAVDAAARMLARTAPRGGGVEVLGPAPAPLALLRGRHRRRLLLKAPRSVHVQKLLRRWLHQVRTGGGTRIQIDVDPYSFM